MSAVALRPVGREDIRTVWEMQIEAFKDLLEKYQDYGTSPGAESFEKVLVRYEQPFSKYYFIIVENVRVGVIRIVDRKDGSRKRVSPLWIMPEHRRMGYARAAMAAAEQIYGPEHWCLDTILQEEGNIRLYEKMGYRRTGRIDRINDRMDIVYFEKD